ncbi:hypothetical protein D3C86_1774980 [compost metagenome]
MLDEAVVHEKELLTTRFTGKFGLANVPADVDIGGVFLAIGELLAVAFAVNIDNPFHQLHRLKVENLRIVMMKRERNLRVG